MQSGQDSDKYCDNKGTTISQMGGDLDRMIKENYWQVSFEVRLDHQEEVNSGKSSEVWQKGAEVRVDVTPAPQSLRMYSNIRGAWNTIYILIV